LDVEKKIALDFDGNMGKRKQRKMDKRKDSKGKKV